MKIRRASQNPYSSLVISIYFGENYDGSQNPSRIDFQNQYIDQGTPGLKDYAEQKSLASGLRSTLSNAAYVDYYDAVRANTLDISEAIATSREAFFDLEAIYPETNFFDVYFLVGAMTAGGRISDNGLLIAVEMFSKNEDTNLDELSEWHQNVLRSKQYLPSIVVHEFVHLQQNFRPTNSNVRTVLEQSIFEGMADFIAFHLLGNRPFFNDHLHTYGNPIEETLWEEFDAQKDLDFQGTEWLYTGRRTAQGHPADMGYYMGFKILEAYSTKFETVETAIVAMLTTTDYEEIFNASGYAEKFE